jgi:hypothetical protein
MIGGWVIPLANAPEEILANAGRCARELLRKLIEL